VVCKIVERYGRSGRERQNGGDERREPSENEAGGDENGPTGEKDREPGGNKRGAEEARDNPGQSER
jgi:hypothetical protein